MLQAAIAACHARAPTAAQTDWKQIDLLYQALAVLAPSLVVDLNRAIAVAMADSPERGLQITDRLAAEPALAGYHHLPSVRGDLLARLGHYAEAAGEFRRAASLTRNIHEPSCCNEQPTATRAPDRSHQDRHVCGDLWWTAPTAGRQASDCQLS